MYIDSFQTLLNLTPAPVFTNALLETKTQEGKKTFIPLCPNPKLMNDKLIVVLDSILHLLLEERPIINHIKPAILMTPVDSLTLFVMSSFFLIDVYNDMRIKQNVASGSGTG